MSHKNKKNQPQDLDNSIQQPVTNPDAKNQNRSANQQNKKAK
jgi:hypothetical protein